MRFLLLNYFLATVNLGLENVETKLLILSSEAKLEEGGRELEDGK